MFLLLLLIEPHFSSYFWLFPLNLLVYDKWICHLQEVNCIYLFLIQSHHLKYEAMYFNKTPNLFLNIFYINKNKHTQKMKK